MSTPLSEGTFRARATECLLGKSSRKSTPFVGVMFVITQGESKGQHVKWDGYLTEGTAETTIKALQACGWEGDDLSAFAKGLEGLDRNEVDLVIEMEPYEGNDEKYRGKSFPRVRWVNRAGGGVRFAGDKMDVAEAAAFGAKYRGLVLAVKAKAGASPAATAASRPVVGKQTELQDHDDPAIPF